METKTKTLSRPLLAFVTKSYKNIRILSKLTKASQHTIVSLCDRLNNKKQMLQVETNKSDNLKFVCQMILSVANHSSNADE